jgi:hypothetical protein
MTEENQENDGQEKRPVYTMTFHEYKELTGKERSAYNKESFDSFVADLGNKESPAAKAVINSGYVPQEKLDDLMVENATFEAERSAFEKEKDRINAAKCQIKEIAGMLNTLPDYRELAEKLEAVEKEHGAEGKTDGQAAEDAPLYLAGLLFDDVAEAHEAAIEVIPQYKAGGRKLRKKYSIDLDKVREFACVFVQTGDIKGNVEKRDHVPFGDSVWKVSSCTDKKKRMLPVPPYRIVREFYLGDDIMDYSKEAEEKLKEWGAAEGEDYTIEMSDGFMGSFKKPLRILTKDSWQTEPAKAD